MILRFIQILLLFLSTNLVVFATDSTKITILSEMQIRSELDGRDFSNSTDVSNFSLMRTRLGFQTKFLNTLNLFIQIQDARLFGDYIQGNNSNETRLYQASLELKDLFIENFSLRIGRFELNKGNKRHFSNNSFSIEGKSIDGFEINYNFEKVSFSAFNIISSTNQNNIENGHPSNFPFPTLNDIGSNTYGLWSFVDFNEFKINSYLYYDLNRKKTDGINIDLNKYNIGSDITISYQDWKLTAEANYQFGKSSKKEIDAFQFASNIFYNINTSSSINLGYDVLSGQIANDNTIIKAFTVIHGEKHEFYGRMNYFSYSNSFYYLGIKDLFININFNSFDDYFSHKVSYHYFESEKSSLTDKSNLGSEIDFITSRNLNKKVMFEFGICAFIPDDLMKEYFYLYKVANREDISFWAYLQICIKM